MKILVFTQACKIFSGLSNYFFVEMQSCICYSRIRLIEIKAKNWESAEDSSE